MTTLLALGLAVVLLVTLAAASHRGKFPERRQPGTAPGLLIDNPIRDKFPTRRQGGGTHFVASSAEGENSDAD